MCCLICTTLQYCTALKLDCVFALEAMRRIKSDELRQGAGCAAMHFGVHSIRCTALVFGVLLQQHNLCINPMILAHDRMLFKLSYHLL